jgi:tight adherence protein C
MADRAPVGEVRNLAVLLIQSGRLGTSVASALTDLADGYRVSLRQRAEAQANRTSFWMLFPTTFCLLVSAAIILIAPAFLEFSQQRLTGIEGISGGNQPATAPIAPSGPAR